MNLLGVRDLDRAALTEWLDAAGAARSLSDDAHAGRAVALVFNEPSTRTRFSFERAAGRLGAQVLPFSPASSSATKGESLLDTARLLVAVGAELLVVRDRMAGTPHHLAARTGVAVVNAGDGANEHPTQGLVDAFTLREHFGSLVGLSVAIVGDVRHSRVARSSSAALTALGARVTVAGPRSLVPREYTAEGVAVAHLIDDVIGMDAIMMLRVQRERLGRAQIGTVADYRAGWGLTEARAERMAAHARVLHPAPINRGVEIDDAVADGAHSLIQEQQRNGVPVRMAVLDRCLRMAR